MHLTTLLLHQNATTYLKGALISLALSLLYLVIRALADPLKRVPGPVWARFSRLWLVKQIFNENMEDTQLELHKKYGPVVRVAPNQYSLNDLEATKQIYAYAGKFPKSDFYSAFGTHIPVRAGLFNETDEKRHAEKRKRVANLYSLTSLLSYEAFVDQNNKTLISQLSKMASQHTAFPVAAWMQYYAFDVIGAITVGEPFGFLDHGYDFQGIIGELHAGQKYGSRLGAFWGPLHPLVTKLGPYVGYYVPRYATRRYILNNIDRKRKLVSQGETTEEQTGKQDFLEKLFALEEKGKVGELDIENTVGNNINAGSDTTGISLASVIYNLAKHPDVLQKLRDEIQEYREAGKVSCPITFKEAQELPYLQAVIKEALRVHPAVGLSLSRVVPEGGATMAGHYFPGGTVVGVNPWVIHQNTDAFGADAAYFRPERWLESKERSAEMDHYFLTFGAGSRTCIGRHVSLLEMNKVIPELVTKFDFELEEPDKKLTKHNIFFVLPDYRCYVKERDVELV